MTVKKIGRAVADPEAGFWEVEAKPERFLMNPRLVDTRPDVKALRAVHSRLAAKKSPTRRRPKIREEFLREKKNKKIELKNLLTQVYGEILKESFSCPVLIRKDRDDEHNGDWRYCLYQGTIYQFDRPGYPDAEMVRQIESGTTAANL